MANETLGASFSIDVTDLKAGLAQANRMIRESESEFKAAASGMDDWRESEEGLTAKINSLNKITEVQRAKVGALQSEYDRLIENGLDPASREAVELRTKINNETAALNKNEAELEKQQQALKELANQSDETGEETEEMGEKFSGLKAAAQVAVGAIAAVGAACVAAVGAFLGLAESTREARNNMAKLETAFETAGHSAEAAENTFTELYGILGDDGAATEAAQQLAKMSKNEADLAANTRILTGVMAEYGASIPTEGLAEGMAATAAMGSVQGVLADALEWQGVNLDDYNAKLSKLATEEERAAYIQSTLTDLYGASADAYRENNAEIIAAQEAQAGLNQALNELGAIAEPIMTTLKTIATELLQSILPFVELMGNGLAGALNGSATAADDLAAGLSGVLTTLVDKVAGALPVLISTVAQIIPAVVSSIVEALPSIVDAIASVLPDLVGAILGLLPSLVDAVVSLVLQVISAAAEVLPDIITAVVGIIPELISQIVAAVPQLIEAFITLLMSVVQALPTVITNLIGALPALIQTIIDALLTALPMVIEAAKKLLMSIVQAIPVIIEALGKELPNIITTIIDGLVKAIPMLVEGAIQLLMAIIAAIPTIIDELSKALPSIINAIIDGLLGALPSLLQGAIQLLMAIVQAIPSIISILVKDIPKLVTTIINSLLSRLPDLINGAIKLLMGIVAAIPLIVIELVKQLPTIIKTIVSSLGDGFSQIKDVGKNLIKGLWEGISDMASWIGEKIKGFGGDILGGLKSFFGINSPSKLMEEQVGKNLALGIGRGFEKNIAGVNDEITKAMTLDDAAVNISASGQRKLNGGVVVYQTNNYAQAHSRLELYKTKQATAAAVRLAMAGA